MKHPKKEEQKNERYNRIALEAAKQCGRGVLPDVALPLPNFGAVCRSFDQYDLVLFCYECGGAPLRQLLAEAKPAACSARFCRWTRRSKAVRYA